MAVTEKRAKAAKVAKSRAASINATKKATKKAIKSTNSKNDNNKKIKVTQEQRHKMICEAAYYISLDKTYETVNPTADWLEAESFINQICTTQ